MATLNFRVSRNADAVKESGGEYISQSGVYPVKILFVSQSESDKGAISFNINIEYKGNEQVFFGPTIQNIDGKSNKIGSMALNKLFVLADMPEGMEPAVETETHNIGREQTPTELLIFTDLSDMECQMQVIEEFTKYKGEIKRKLNPVSFFAEDGATADEVLAIEAGSENVTRGTQLSKILAKESTTKHKLGKDENKVPVTQAEVDAFIKAKAEGKKAGPATQGVKPKKNLFAK